MIYVTATPMFDEAGNIIIPPTMTPDEPTPKPIDPTPNPARTMPQGDIYVVQPGTRSAPSRTSTAITMDELNAANPSVNPNALEVNQALTIPGGALRYTPANKLIPDSELVYSVLRQPISTWRRPSSSRQGFLKAYSEDIGDGQIMSGVEIIDFVATNYSVNPRLLLALLEYRGQWLSDRLPRPISR